MVKVLRHSQKKWRATGLPYLSPRRHSLTLPADAYGMGKRMVFRVVNNQWYDAPMKAIAKAAHVYTTHHIINQMNDTMDVVTP